MAEILAARQLLQGNPLLFPNPDTGEVYTSLKKALLTICKKLDIKPFEPAYQLRHLFGTNQMTYTRGNSQLVECDGIRGTLIKLQRVPS